MNEHLLLCTDLDRTLLPNGNQPESSGARERFTALVQLPAVTLVYVTGRHRELVEDAISNYRLPRPDYAITDVGTRIYRIEHGDWRPWPQWETEIDSDWGGMGHAQLRELFRDLPELQLQEASKQNTHKLSFYVPLDADRWRILAEDLRQAVREQAWSEREGLYLEGPGREFDAFSQHAQAMAILSGTATAAQAKRILDASQAHEVESHIATPTPA